MELSTTGQMTFVFCLFYLIIMGIYIDRHNNLYRLYRKREKLNRLKKVSDANLLELKNELTPKIKRVRRSAILSLFPVPLAHIGMSLYYHRLFEWYLTIIIVLFLVFLTLTVLALMLKGFGTLDKGRRFIDTTPFR
jgi:uncharacterized membrane protein YdbT with pleckstrin-like domain